MNRYCVRLCVDYDVEGQPLADEELCVDADDFEITDGGGLIFYRKAGSLQSKYFGVAPEAWQTVERIEVN